MCSNTMKKLTFRLIIALILSACSEEEFLYHNHASEIQPSTTSLNAVEFMQNKQIDYSINDSGIVIFNKAQDLFKIFNDYHDIKFNSDFDFVISIEIPKHTSENERLIIIRKAFLYGVYQTFAHTNANTVTVEALAIDSQNHNSLNKLKAKISRDKALDVLRQYSKANSFKDLVELEDNDHFKVKGYSSSLYFDKFVTDLKTQREIVLALTE